MNIVHSNRNMFLSMIALIIDSTKDRMVQKG